MRILKKFNEASQSDDLYSIAYYYFASGYTDFAWNYKFGLDYNAGFKALYPTLASYKKAVIAYAKKEASGESSRFNSVKEDFQILFQQYNMGTKEPLTKEILSHGSRAPRKNWEKALAGICKIAFDNFISYDFLLEQYGGETNGYVKNPKGFSVPDTFIKNVKMEGGIDNIKNWKAKNLYESNGGKKGEWNEVGYVGIYADSNILVPVPRDDEHRAGREYIWESMRKKILPKSDNFVCIWALSSNNYFYYYDDEDPKKTNERYIICINKFFSYGGQDSKLKIYPNGQVPGFEREMFDTEFTLSEFVKVGGVFGLVEKYGKGSVIAKEKDAPPAKLNSDSKSFLSSLEEFALKAREKVPRLYLLAKEILEDVETFSKAPTIKQLTYNIVNDIDMNIQDRDLDMLIMNILGTAGLKNLIHTFLKKKVLGTAMEKTYDKLFGSTKLFVKGFDRISKI
jgi:hypothetical protein